MLRGSRMSTKSDWFTRARPWRRKHDDNGEDGQIIVEAALILPLYLMFSIALLQLVIFAAAQARVEVAVNSTARELSQFTYVTGGDLGGYAQQAVNAYGSIMQQLTGDSPGLGSDSNPIAQILQTGDGAAQTLLRARLDSASDTLSGLGVVDGADGLIVNPESTITDGDQIELIVDYKLRVPFVNIEIPMTAKAQTARWEYSTS